MKNVLEMDARKLNMVLDMTSNLTPEQLAAVAEHIMNLMASTKAENKDTCHALVYESRPNIPDCPHCKAKASLGFVVKSGFKSNGAQRYRCKTCGKYFVSTTGTAFARTRKSPDTWRKYIAMLLDGKSIKACAAACELSIQISFEWRHKILNTFQVHMQDTKMTGTVEVDEMLIPLSYKGNHVQGGFGTRRKGNGAINNMPRKAFRRGSDNKPTSSKERACVFCMVEDGRKTFYASVPGVGFMTEAMLDHTVGRHIVRETAMMLADNYKITHNYFEKHGYQHTILASNTSDNPHDHKPEIQGDLHMQHVNAMHHHLREFLRQYHGVSSKYLGNYVALYVWLRSVRTVKQRKSVDEVSLARAASPDCYITGDQIYSRPAVPQCA